MNIFPKNINNKIIQVIIGIFYCLFLVSAPNCFSSNNLDALLNRLDKTIAERKYFMDIREKRIFELKQILKTSDISLEQAYECNTRLYSEYKTYNCDSAFYYAENALRIAQFWKHDYCIPESKLNVVSVFNVIGMYKEALDVLASINRNALPNELKIRYFNNYKEVYGNYSNNNVYAIEYKQISDTYRDSLLNCLDKTSDHYLIVYSEKLLEQNQTDKSCQILFDLLRNTEIENHLFAVLTHGIAGMFMIKGDKEQAKIYYAKSAIADLKSAIKENASMQALALLLYESGDLNHAYKYIKYSLEDAIFCNARLRTFEISNIFPIINEAYQLKVRKQQVQMRWFTFSISLLSIFLLVALFYIYRQMKKVARARKELSASNEQLKALNIELQVLNNDLSETVHIKEEYIGRYMDLCLNYIDKMDKYRRSLSKIAEHESLEKLYSAIKSTQILENELKEFYADFDNTFLLLFPTFVKDFNKLLTGELLPKAGERMNTELRIFALIRLGITDSHKIAHFLRYSVTTIFNYRTRIRNISVGDRNDLEKKVMQIGRTVK